MKRSVVAMLAAALGVVGLAALTMTTTSTASASSVAAKATPTQWKFVSAAGNATCAIDTKQKLWCWGYNSNGQLGIGTSGSNANVATPTKVDNSSWLTVRTSFYSTCGIKTDRTAWCWGYNGVGQLGNGTNGPGGGDTSADSNVPVRVLGDVKWAKITAGGSNSCGISTSGALYCTGDDAEGSLGDGEGNTQTNTMRRIGTATNWAAVTAGYYHSCALNSSRKAFCWGSGDNGATGTGANEDTYSPVALSGAWKSINTIGFTTCGVTSTGVSKCWGDNNSGEVGNGNTTDTNTPTTLATGAKDFVRLRPGTGYSCGITAAQTVRCFGYNGVGQFGNGTTDSSLTPVSAAAGKTWTQLSFGDHHACGIRNGGKLFCWGDGFSGQLGNRSNNYVNPDPILVGSAPRSRTSDTPPQGKARYPRGPMFARK